MITFEKLTLRNFLSYGNVATEINLVNNDVILIQGQNGTGKTTIAAGVVYALYNKALAFRDGNIHKVNTYDEFKEALKNGGFISAHWDGTPETEEKIKEETKATIRCIPLNNAKEEGVCIYSGKPSNQRVLFAIAY